MSSCKFPAQDFYSRQKWEKLSYELAHESVAVARQLVPTPVGMSVCVCVCVCGWVCVGGCDCLSVSGPLVHCARQFFSDQTCAGSKLASPIAATSSVILSFSLPHFFKRRNEPASVSEGQRPIVAREQFLLPLVPPSLFGNPGCLCQAVGGGGGVEQLGREGGWGCGGRGRKEW